MAETKNIQIGGRLHSIATGNVLTGADEILDDNKGKKQSEINMDIDDALADRYTKDETYNKNELNSLITTPDVQYISIIATEQTTAVTDILPSVGAANTIYRVGKWNGTQYNTAVYSEYAWNSTAYVLLDVKEYGIDAEPTAGSDNLVKSGGVAELIDTTHLVNPTNKSLSKAEEVMQLKSKLEGVTAEETKVPLITSGEGQNVYPGIVSPTTGGFSTGSQKIVIIPVSGITSVRMLIATIRESSQSALGYSFGNITSGTKPDSTLSNYTPNHIYAFEHVGTESLPLEVTVPVPSDSSWLCVTNWVTLLGDSFYAYTRVGDSVVDLITKSKEQVEEQIDKLNNEINIFKYVPSTSITGLYVAADGGIASYNNVVLRYAKVEANTKIKIIGTTTTVAGSNFRMGVSAEIPVNGGSVIDLEALPAGTQNFEKEYIPSINGYFCISYLASYGSVVIEKETLAFEKEYEEQIELVLGNFNDNLGGIKGGVTNDSVVMKSFISTRYKKNGCKLISITGIQNDETLSIFMYDANASFLGIANDIAYIDDLCEFIAFRLSKETAYNESVRLLTLNYVGSDKIDKIYYATQPSNDRRFITFEVSRTNSIEPNNAAYSQNAQRLYTNGYIITPPNYTVDGEPVPLAIFVHGTGGYVFDEVSIEYYGDLLKFVAKNGYAVVDCCTMTNLYSETTDINGNTRTEYKDTNYPCRLSVDCYVSLYKYVTKMFNVDKEKVYIWGKSSGGRLAPVLGQSKLIPIKAVGILNGSTDSFTDFRVLGQPSRIAVKKLMEDDLGFIFPTSEGNEFVKSPNIAFKDANSVSSDLIEFLLSNKDKIAGFNPLFTGVSNLDIDTYERAQFSCSLNAADIGTSLTDNDTLMGQVNAGFKTSLVPTKIWAAQDDENVPYPMAVIYTKLVKRGGGICELRTIPAGNGKHWAVDIAQPNLGQLYPGKGFPNDLPYAPKTSYVTKFGETVSEVTVTYAELVDWFNRW